MLSALSWGLFGGDGRGLHGFDSAFDDLEGVWAQVSLSDHAICLLWCGLLVLYYDEKGKA